MKIINEVDWWTYILLVLFLLCVVYFLNLYQTSHLLIIYNWYIFTLHYIRVNFFSFSHILICQVWYFVFPHRELKSMKNLLYLDVYGILDDRDLATVRDNLPNIKVNKYLFSSVARPTVGVRRTSIWGVRVRD